MTFLLVLPIAYLIHSEARDYKGFATLVFPILWAFAEASPIVGTVILTVLSVYYNFHLDQVTLVSLDSHQLISRFRLSVSTCMPQRT